MASGTESDEEEVDRSHSLPSPMAHCAVVCQRTDVLESSWFTGAVSDRGTAHGCTKVTAGAGR